MRYYIVANISFVPTCQLLTKMIYILLTNRQLALGGEDAWSSVERESLRKAVSLLAKPTFLGNRLFCSLPVTKNKSWKI